MSLKVERWLRQHTESLHGKTVAVTGSTGGLGRELCRYLLRLGAALILMDRNKQRSDAWREQLLLEYPNAKIGQIPLDLSRMESVRAACECLEAEPLDVLIHNAGAYHIPRVVCDTGYDNVFQINFVSPYYMTARLLPHLQRRGGRVVLVGSIAHRYAQSDESDVDFSKRRRHSLAYGNAKRYLMTATPALLKDAEGVTLALTHPGICYTGITAHYPPWLFALIKYPMKLIFMPPSKAALCVLRGVFAPTLDGWWWGPWCLDIWGRPVLRRLRSVSPSEASSIRQTARSIYQSLSKNKGGKHDVLSFDVPAVTLGSE